MKNEIIAMAGLGWSTRAPGDGSGRPRWFLPAWVLAAIWLAGIAMGWSQQGASRDAPHLVIRGLVLDSEGDAVSGATVWLVRAEGMKPREATSKAGGDFSFADVEAGSYSMRAEKGEQHSRTTLVIVPGSGAMRSVQLTLAAAPAGDAGRTAAPAMEFADAPNFTVAAVTDWTAAGGHGSDANLRTSEALNRETALLKPEGSGTGNPGGAEPKESESALQAAQVAAPGNFAANHKLGEFYLRAGRFGDALPLLENAYKSNPANTENAYDLGLALKGKGDIARAREYLKGMLVRQETADLHRLAGEVDERAADPLAAVHEFEQAAREDPSEQNYFEWGSELLLHRAVLQARDVFAAGAKAFPRSERMLTALGAALFAGALYDDAARRLCEASDLNPADAEPYLFMGRAEMAAPSPLPCVQEKLARFAELRPKDPLANYFYAMAVWKQQGQAADAKTLARVEGMLTRAVTLDPQCSDAYLQLGVLAATQRDYAKAIGLYTQAIAANAQMSEAHYRLGVAYDRVGEKAKAKGEFQLHDEIEKRRAAEVERQRKEVKQFLVVAGKEDDPESR
jgi:tetratricopeptide (TPR) repeat protein